MEGKKVKQSSTRARNKIIKQEIIVEQETIIEKEEVEITEKEKSR